MIENIWRDYVSDKVLSLLERSIERRIKDHIKHPFLPSSGERFIFHKKYDKLGKCIFIVETKTGIETSQSTKKRDFDSLDIFHFDCFLSLSEKEKLAVLGYIDPFDELKDKNDFIEFIKYTGLNSNKGYNYVLEKAMFKLQRLCEQKGIVESMNKEDVISGLKQIAEYFHCSIPTLYKLIDKHKIPVAVIEGKLYALKSKLDEKKLEMLNDENNYLYNVREKRRSKNGASG